MRNAAFPCPNCGEPVPGKAKACPHCGSDENTGWSENTYLDGVGQYNEEDYQETLRREFGITSSKDKRKNLFFGLLVVIVIILFLVFYIIKPF